MVAQSHMDIYNVYDAHNYDDMCIKWINNKNYVMLFFIECYFYLLFYDIERMCPALSYNPVYNE